MDMDISRYWPTVSSFDADVFPAIDWEDFDQISATALVDADFDMGALEQISCPVCRGRGCWRRYFICPGCRGIGWTLV